MVQLQPMCGEGAAASASAAAEDPELSRSVGEAKGCGHDVITLEGSLPANYWRHQESDVLALIWDGLEGV